MENDVDIVTREEIKDFLIETGMRREEFGARLGVCLVTVNGWMSIRTIPKKKQILIRKMIDSHNRQASMPVVRVTCTTYESDYFRSAAELVGESVNEFIVRACRMRADAILGGRTVRNADTLSGGIGG